MAAASGGGGGSVLAIWSSNQAAAASGGGGGWQGMWGREVGSSPAEVTDMPCLITMALHAGGQAPGSVCIATSATSAYSCSGGFPGRSSCKP